MDVAAVGAVELCVNLEPGGRLSTFPSAHRADDTDSETEDTAFLQKEICVTSKFRNDEPGLIIPLLHDFLENHLKPMANCGTFGIEGVSLKGVPGHYFNSTSDRPRAYAPGYWAGFGHVSIDGTFSAMAQVGNATIDGPGYLIEYTAQYEIIDKYEWFPEQNKVTPVPFPLGWAEIPHEWTASLQDDLAKEFDFRILWTESDVLWVSFSFDEFRSTRWGGFRQQIRGNYEGPH